jgi:hypothetical protein
VYAARIFFENRGRLVNCKNSTFFGNVYKFVGHTVTRVF